MAMCLSCGFCNVDIVSRSIDVQLGSGGWINLLLHVSNEGLIVVMRAYSMWVGGWFCLWDMYWARCGYFMFAS